MEQRDWATWDMEHPYIPHPREPGAGPRTPLQPAPGTMKEVSALAGDPKQRPEATPPHFVVGSKEAAGVSRWTR